MKAAFISLGIDCTVLCCVVLYCTVPYFTVSYRNYCPTLYRTVETASTGLPQSRVTVQVTIDTPMMRHFLRCKPTRSTSSATGSEQRYPSFRSLKSSSEEGGSVIFQCPALFTIPVTVQYNIRISYQCKTLATGDRSEQG